MTDLPAIGISKKLCCVFGLENNNEHKQKIEEHLKKSGDFFELLTNEYPNAQRIGLCYRSVNGSKNPLYISIGHKISWETALWLIKLVTTKYRIPEPIRQADLKSREFLRQQKLAID
jgi:endonuclease V